MRHTALYTVFFWLGLLVGFLAFEALAPGAVSTAIRAMYKQEWSAAWVLIGCGLAMAFVGAIFGSVYERIAKHRAP